MLNHLNNNIKHKVILPLLLNNINLLLLNNINNHINKISKHIPVKENKPILLLLIMQLIATNIVNHHIKTISKIFIINHLIINKLLLYKLLIHKGYYLINWLEAEVNKFLISIHNKIVNILKIILKGLYMEIALDNHILKVSSNKVTRKF